MASQVPKKTLNEWLVVLESRYSQPIKLGLERVQKVAAAMDLLRPEAVVVTVAGTNGKGSTVAALSAIYEKAGYTVGSFVSPHVHAFNERIRINQRLITDSELIRCFERIETHQNQMELSYFETVTLAALEHFKQHTLDLIILEVGLGGRLDATNIIDSDLAIITTIGFDHQEYLGDSLDAIGFEKAGVMRAHKTVIYADDVLPKSIQLKALELPCTLLKKNVDYSYTFDHSHIVFSCGDKTIEYNCPNLHPNSTAAAIRASICLDNSLPLNDAHRVEGLANLQLLGRYHYFQCPHPTLLDVSHNGQAAENLARFLNKRHPGKKLLLVFSALKDKNIAAIKSAFADNSNCTWFPALLSGNRALKEEDLVRHFTGNVEGFKPCYTSPLLAYHAACEQADAGCLVVVFGSFLTVSEVFSFLTAN